MNIQSTTNNYFRTAAHVGVRQKVGRRKALDLPGGLLLWRAIGKILLWGVPAILALNLWCASSIDNKILKSEELNQNVQLLESSNAALQKQMDRLVSPVRVKIAAAEKLSLFEPEPGQIKRM